MPIQIHKNKTVETGKPYYWYAVVAENGETLVSSEQFTRKANCMKSIYSLLEVVRDERTRVVDLTK
jgi:uncharacterized protein YegP (UPF0339 family)